jgi:hypothetical protein
MKNRRTWMIAGFFLLAAVGAQAALQKGARPILVCGDYLKGWGLLSDDNCFSTCGGEIPWPFQASNQVVELANEERYVLMGSIEFRDGFPRFVVDLEEHPWLATAQRKLDPSYRLLGTLEYWKRFESKRIQLRAVARWLPVSTPGNALVEVALDSLVEPAVVSSSGSNDEI